jgi:REase_MTES_1575/Protein of unknown function (DUF4011)
MPIDIKAKPDELRTKLLNLTNRNRLLNFRLTKRRSVQIFDELPNQVYQRLVLDEKGFYRKPLDEEGDGELLALSSEDGDLTTDLDRTPDSDFELAVAETVRSMGFKVVPQVGVAGFYVDVAVLRPNHTDEFILGIECDGAT